MAWFVLVLRACHGGWWFQPVADALRLAGHTTEATSIAERLRHDPDWTVTGLDTRHNFLANGPAELLKLILDFA